MNACGRFACIIPLLLAVSCGGDAQWQPAEAPAVIPTPAAHGEEPADDGFGDEDTGLKGKIAQFAPAVIGTDLSKLPAEEKAALDKLIEASKLLDAIFDRQVYAKNPELEKTLAADTSAEGKDKLAYFRIMRGPWDRQDHFKPFASDDERPKGAGFYPTDLTDTELDAYLKKNPGQKKAVLHLFTVVERNGKRLKVTPYSKAYAE